MAKFRRNHDRAGTGRSSGTIARVGLFAAILGGMFFAFNQFAGGGSENEAPAPANRLDESIAETDYYLPTGGSGDIIRKKYYTLSYSEAHEQAEWVAYVLTEAQVRSPWVDRQDNFREDPAVESGSASPEDYRHSGYDRGHLAPVADRSFSEAAMEETFYMSNISPQARNFNGGIWRELEELTRSWAKKDGRLFVVTGPVLSSPPKGRIGDNEVSVPAAFFKVLLDLDEPVQKGVGFIIPNQVSYEPLYDFARSIDEVEARTGLDFFPDLLDQETEAALESDFNLDLWYFSKQKFEERTQKWNKR